MGDLATWYLALGAAMFMAVRRASWRVPVLVVALLQTALHSLNHLIDVGEADPDWLGPANLVALVLAAVLLGLDARTERRRRDEGVRGRRDGAIGRPLLAPLVARGHEVTGTTRSEERAEAIRAAGAAAVVGRPRRGRAAAGGPRAAPEVVVHELTALPERFDPRKKGSTTPRTACASRARATCSRPRAPPGARRFVCQSIAFAYAPRRGAVKDEGAPLVVEAPAPFGEGVRVLQEMERSVLDADWLEGIVLRYGWFYGPGTYYGEDGSTTSDVRKRRFP